MAGLPPLKYGRVKGRFLAVVPDGPDEGTEPDFPPLTGNIRFTLRASKILVPGAVPVPATVMPTVHTAQLDEFGYLTWRGNRFIDLLASSPDTNPIDWTYTVSFDLRYEGRQLPISSFDIEVPPYVPSDPGSIVDLTEAAPVPGSQGGAVVRGPKGWSVTDVSLSADGSALVFRIDRQDGTFFTDSVTVPAFPKISDAQSFAAIAGGAATVATQKAEEASGSASAAALSAVEASQYVGGVADGTISTPKIIDGAVTLPKLSAGVQASLSKADSAVQPAGLTAAINGLVDAAPGALDTLNELAAALGDDPNIAATVTSSLGLKADKSEVVLLSGAQTVAGNKSFTGTVTVGGQAVVVTNDARLTDTRAPKTGTVPYDFTLPGAGETTTRAVGYNDCALGIKLRRAVTISEIHYRCFSADASGTMTVEIRKNGTAVSGTSASMTAATQTAGATVTGSWSFAKNDVLTVYVTAVGGTPGKGLVADIAGLC